MTNTNTVLISLLAAGLAIALARENRFRRALQDLVTRLITTLRTNSTTAEYRHDRSSGHYQHNAYPAHRRQR